MNPFFTLVDEMFDGREGVIFNGFTGPRTFVRKFLVHTTRPDIPEWVVGTAPGIPLPFSPFVSANGLTVDFKALCVKKTATVQGDADGCRWIVTCEYSTDVGAGVPANIGSPNQQKGAENQPEMQPAELEWDFDEEQRAPPCDLDGKAYVTSADQPFTPSPTVPVAYPVMVMSRWEQNYDIRVAKKYSYVVNDKPFLGEIAGRVLCLPPKAKLQYFGPDAYFRVTYRLKIYIPLRTTNLNGAQVKKPGPETWQALILNQGTRYLDKDPQSPTFKKSIPIVHGHGRAVTPHLLGVNGEWYGDTALGEPEAIRLGFLPTFSQFRTYRSEDLSKLLATGLTAGIKEKF